MGANPQGRGARIPGVWTVADDALLAGLGAGDPDASAAFVRRFQGRVFGLAVTMVGDRAVADDVAQEAFVRAWRHAGAYDARRGSVTTWLLTITRNLAVDALRAMRAVPTDPDVLAGMLPPAGGSGPDGAAVANEDAARVRAALAALPPEQRRAVVLARFSGLTAAEIGEREGVPLGTAKTRIRAGLIRLRDAMAEDPA
ncbi:MAG: polymerase [Actinomycetia bacterium]|nr:polymerase [Actinomycetes bacterium]